MDFSWLVIIVILALDLIVSVWNCYASGFNAAILQHQPSDRLSNVLLSIVNGAGILIGFAGAVYVLLISLGFVTYSLGYISLGSLTFILASNFIVLGGVITWFGIVIMIHSFLIAYKTHTWRSFSVTMWNIFASIWNAVVYLRNFRTMFNAVKEGEENITALVIVILGIAVGIGLAIAYAAYHLGFRRGQMDSTIA
jgi:hypothetical protein